MREDLSLSCRSLSASCILSFSPDLPYSIIDFSHFHTTLSLSFVFFIVSSFKSCFSLSLHATSIPALTSSLSQSHVNWFSLCVMQMFGLVSVAFPMDGIHFTFNKRQIGMVCLHGLCPSDYEALHCVVVSPEWVAKKCKNKCKNKPARSLPPLVLLSLHSLSAFSLPLPPVSKVRQPSVCICVSISRSRVCDYTLISA